MSLDSSFRKSLGGTRANQLLVSLGLMSLPSTLPVPYHSGFLGCPGHSLDRSADCFRQSLLDTQAWDLCSSPLVLALLPWVSTSYLARPTMAYPQANVNKLAVLVGPLGGTYFPQGPYRALLTRLLHSFASKHTVSLM